MSYCHLRTALMRVACACALVFALPACSDSEDGPDDPTETGDGDGDGDGDDEPSNPNARFQKHSYPLPGVAFLLPIAEGDGGHRLLATSLAVDMDFSQLPYRAPFTPGALYDVRRDAADPVGQWQHEVVFGKDAEIRWPNQPGMFDVDNDGDDEIMVPWGFLSAKEGGLAYVDVESNGSYSAPRPIVDRSACAEPEDIECGWYFHEIAPGDFNGDGKLDFATSARWGGVGPMGGNSLMWFENIGGEGEVAFREHEIAAAGGTLVDAHDIDGDGDLDLVLPQFFGGDSLVWFERQGEGADVRFVEHLIDNTTGRGFQIEFGDVDNDGREDIIYVNHNHQDHPDPQKQVMGVYWWSIPEDPASLENWNSTKHVIYEGFEVAPPKFSEPNPDAESAPGHFTPADLNGDGLLDFVVSGDGDPGLYVLDQAEDGTFSIENIDPGVEHANSGVAWVTDINGDDKPDIVWAVFESMPVDSRLFTFIQR